MGDISILYTIPGETALFRALIKNRPIGPSKHWAMMSIHRSLEQALGKEATPSVSDIWKVLGGLYDLQALDDAEDEPSLIPIPSSLPINAFASPRIDITTTDTLAPFYYYPRPPTSHAYPPTPTSIQYSAYSRRNPLTLLLSEPPHPHSSRLSSSSVTQSTSSNQNIGVPLPFPYSIPVALLPPSITPRLPSHNSVREFDPISRLWESDIKKWVEPRRRASNGEEEAWDEEEEETPKKGGGRGRRNQKTAGGSRNKGKAINSKKKETSSTKAPSVSVRGKGRGRPKGSTKKRKLENEEMVEDGDEGMEIDHEEHEDEEMKGESDLTDMDDYRDDDEEYEEEEDAKSSRTSRSATAKARSSTKRPATTTTATTPSTRRTRASSTATAISIGANTEGDGSVTGGRQRRKSTVGRK